jgi:hypothetical protein
MEVSQVRKRVQAAIAEARERAQHRRQRVAEARQAFSVFLEHVATPVARQVAAALKAEGYSFAVSTPADGLRLASERGRDDLIEFVLDVDAPRPQVVARISHTRGSRTMDEERPVKAGAGPEDVTEEDVLSFLLAALEPWLER